MIKLFVDLHEAFFDNQMGNKITMAVGFAMAAICMLLVLALFWL